MRAGRKRLSIRLWRRIWILELLDKGWTMQDTADAAGTFPREIRRVGRRYLQGGLEAALSEDPRPKPLPKFDTRSEAAVVAIACSPPSLGRSRLVSRAAGAGGGATRHRRLGRKKNDPPAIESPRAEALGSKMALLTM